MQLPQIPNYLISLALTGIVDAVSYMVVAPSIVFYVLSVGGTKEQYGMILSAFSLASFCTKPFLGAASDKFGFRIPYFVSLSLSAVGGLVYLVASRYSTEFAVAMMLAGRLLGGIGGASAALGFAYLAKVVPHEKQTQTNSLLSMIRILGMAAGPGVNVLLAEIDTTVLGLKLDPLNSVGLILFGSNVLALLIMYMLLPEPTEDHSMSHPQAHRIKSTSNVGGGYLDIFFYAELFVPILSIFMLNANFQLIETGFAPAASHALGWGPVETSTVLGSISILIFLVMLIVFALSSRGVNDEQLLTIGLTLGMTGYGLVWFMWVWEAPIWHFGLPMMIGVAAFPFLGAPTRSLFTKACDQLEELDGKQGTMQAILSMAASVAGFTTPGLVASYVLLSPEEVEASASHRELSGWALLAPFGSFLVLVGLFYIKMKPNGMGSDEDGAKDEETATETTGLVSSEKKTLRRQSTTRFPAEIHIHRKSAVQIMGLSQDHHHGEHHGDGEDEE